MASWRRVLFCTQIIQIALFCLLIFFPLNSVASPSDAASERVFKEIRGIYFALLKSDPNIKNLPKWNATATQLRNFVRDHANSEYAPNALFLLGRLHEATYRKRNVRTAINRAVAFYELVARDFEGHYLADDALLYLGDIRRSIFDDEVGARAAYYEIVDAYSDADMLNEAKRRIAKAGGRTPPPPKKTKKELTPEPEEKVSEPKAPEIKARSLFGRLFGASKHESQKKTSVAVRPKNQKPVIVIDPGHGGRNDLGALGVGNILEKNVVLDIALYLDELLRERMDARTILTRARDLELTLNDRTEMANSHNADLFISIHANASPNKKASGVETYYLDNTNDKSSLKLAERENSAFNVKSDDLQFILSDLIQNAKLDDSISLAHIVQNTLVSRLSRYYREVNDIGVKKAPFYVLVGAHMPCILVEVSFIDHPIEGQRLSKRRYQKLIAEALYISIKKYFERQDAGEA